MLKSISPTERDDVIAIARKESAGRIDRHAIVKALGQAYAESAACIADYLPQALTEIPAARKGGDIEDLESLLQSLAQSHRLFAGWQAPIGHGAAAIAVIGRALCSLWVDYCKEVAEADADEFIEQWLNSEEVAA